MNIQSQIGVTAALPAITMSDDFFEKLMTVVEDTDESDDRMELLPTMLKRSLRGLMEFEGLVFDFGKKYSPDSNIGYWLAAKTNQQNSFMMYPSGDKSFHVVNSDNYSECRVDSRIFGIMMTLMAFSHGSGRYYNVDEKLSETLAEHYHALRGAFYNLAESIVYDPESQASEEEKEQVRAMSSAITSFLD